MVNVAVYIMTSKKKMHLWESDTSSAKYKSSFRVSTTWTTDCIAGLWRHLFGMFKQANTNSNYMYMQPNPQDSGSTFKT